jgi:hypothetical protein
VTTCIILGGSIATMLGFVFQFAIPWMKRYFAKREQQRRDEIQRRISQKRMAYLAGRPKTRVSADEWKPLDDPAMG